MSSYPQEPPAVYSPNAAYDTEKLHGYDEKPLSHGNSQEFDAGEGQANVLHRDLKGRHMQMIAIGGAIGAGLFVGSGSALAAGGPASLVLCFIIIGVMLLLVMQALAELGVLYPVNGGFFKYNLRFINRSWGFATGWDYAIQWLIILPFELTAASLTLAYWQGARDVNVGVWIAVFLVALSAVQIFGVRGFGEVEFILSLIKVVALLGFIIYAIVLDCGGVAGQPYIGARYWYSPGAFQGGFYGFCSVFVTASFAFGGTELTGLAAAEAANPLRSIPQATKQVFWRITIFYVVSLLMVGLVVPSDADYLLKASGSATQYSPFVAALGIASQGLASTFNVVICLSVLSVANSSAYATTRTLQALASEGMAPRLFEYIDKHGRPIYCVILQLLFGLLAFVGEASTTTRKEFFNWLLALSGLVNFFTWGSICFAHIRFRAGWKAQGRSLDDIPYKAAFGTIGSWIGLLLNMVCLMATFYTSVWADGAGTLNTAKGFFQSYLAAPLLLVLYVGWKIYTRDWTLFIKASEMDITSGMRENLDELRALRVEVDSKKGIKSWPMRMVRALI